MLLAALTAGAEGTKELRPDSTYQCDLWITNGSGNRNCFATIQCDPGQRLYVHIAQPGEKIFLGFSTPGESLTFYIRKEENPISLFVVNTVPGTPGHIQYYAQAVAGPKVLNPHGYTPIVFTPPEPGDYSIDFVVPPPPHNDNLTIRLLDITVIDTTLLPWVPVNGRLWSKDWGFHTGENTVPTNAMLARQFIYTSDSIVTSLDYNHMRGWNFDITSTRNGCFPPPAAWDTSCLSRPKNHHYAEYKIFINDPDSLEYPTGIPGMILGDTIGITRNCNGTFIFSFHVSKPGDVQMNIESNLTPGIQTEDVTIKYPVYKGLNTIAWNGLNALGQPVPCGDSVAVTFTYINGLTNIALYDVETHPQGFIIEQVRPPGLPIATYWNDTLLAAFGGEVQLSGCYPVLPDTGCHSWTGGVGFGIGSIHTVNTWWFAGSSVLELGRLRIECVPHTPLAMLGPEFPCTYPVPLYTVDPDPLPGTEPSGYEWVLSDETTGTVLLDSVDTGPSVAIDFSRYPPGKKRLKTRGYNIHCGWGLFGPPPAGMLIEPVPSPHITNPVTTWSICSGDSIVIVLQPDMEGTTFSYTALASSPSVTGCLPGTVNPIRQQLFNSGNTMGSVHYAVVPFHDPCFGDTAVFTVTVSPVDTVICQIIPSANPVCEGSPVSLSIDPPVVDSTAIYEWQVNQTVTGPNLPVFTYLPDAGDEIQCTITSTLFCTPNHQATTNTHIIAISPLVSPSLSLTPSSIPACEGDSLSLFANPVHGGTNPVYHWWLNGTDPGLNTSWFTWIPVQGDHILCQMIPSLTCVTDSLVSDSLDIQVQGPVKELDTLLCSGTTWFAEGAWQTQPGTYHDTLNPPVDCISYLISHVTYQPEISSNLGEDQPLCEPSILLDAFCQGGAYLWHDSSTNATFLATEPGVYSVRVEVNGCRKTDSITLGECPLHLWIPTAFTPNGDGLNDRFRVTGDELSGFSMKIYDRWGQILFQTTSRDEGWDGMCHGAPCPPDTYVYVILYVTPTGESSQAQGHLTLIR